MFCVYRRPRFRVYRRPLDPKASSNPLVLRGPGLASLSFQTNLSFLSQSPGPCLHSLWPPEVCLDCCQLLLLFGHVLIFLLRRFMKILPFQHHPGGKRSSSPPFSTESWGVQTQEWIKIGTFGPDRPRKRPVPEFCAHHNVHGADLKTRTL